MVKHECSAERWGPYLHVKYKGEEYDIPELWISGFLCVRPGLTLIDAIKHWHEQEMLDRRFPSHHV